VTTGKPFKDVEASTDWSKRQGNKRKKEKKENLGSDDRKALERRGGKH